MGTPYPGAMQVGSYFVEQYYQVLQQQPHLIHQFYSDSSKMIRVDVDSTHTADTLLNIHNMVMSLNFTAIEVKTINSVESWEGGILVAVSGSVKAKELGNRRSFMHTFFLAPQEKGYFVLNDIFQFIDQGLLFSHHHLNPPTPHPEPQVHDDYVVEQEASDYVNSVQINDDLVDKYSLQEDQYQPHHEEDYEDEVAVQESPREEVVVVDVVHEPRPAPPEEPLGEKSKMSYASILRVAKEAAAVPVAATQPSYNEWDQPLRTPSPQLAAPPQQSNAFADYGAEADGGFGFEDFEIKSVYVRNLPSNISASEIEEEFKNFGTIKPDGVFLRTRKDVIGVCYAFVEYEDMTSVENAIKASPIYLGGRQVYIEGRRPNPAGVRGARGRGRGRGGYPTEAPRGRFGSRGVFGRGNQEGGDYRPRGNGNYRGGGR
ncbi:Nuclear transport factor 2 (NTF2) family protein with RNA binding (RRM-RBD-RNP motifs) domain [Raphanus sativus]|uniref:Nuclear transport factor 2 n=1 Tax=Raphanus sativus TaxID=3726 RepID=A0A6J0NL43_RAPSA|nr:nuclear transport factor 2 [Raphanus sativus]KAJ4901729.1 Nuclear transport factor 2 (NTF2) family protein with RNA binding (RRM-RBD-RNP motifs) domain [Raphanus sativus]